METAFEATVGAIEDPSGWVRFDVTYWYLTDYGTTFSMWAPNFESQVGDTWLVAGALCMANGQQSGEVFPCVSTRSTDTTRQDWASRPGGEPTQAVDVMRFCVLDRPSTVTLIGDLFDFALSNAGAITDPIEFDAELGYIRSFYARDRSVEAGAYVEMFQPRGLFALAMDWNSRTPDEMIASFDPELGYPVEARIDSRRDAVDDELTFFVCDFQVTD